MHAIFYTHQTSGMCAGVCMCDRLHQMEKTVSPVSFMVNQFLYYYERKWHLQTKKWDLRKVRILTMMKLKMITKYLSRRAATQEAK